MESIQEKMLLCNISPTVSPKRRAKSTQRDMFEIGSSYMSQDQNMSPTQNYHMVRTLSSPSIIDASPKKTMHEVMDISTTISPTSVQTGSFESKSSNTQTSNKHDLTMRKYQKSRPIEQIQIVKDHQRQNPVTIAQNVCYLFVHLVLLPFTETAQQMHTDI
jgi:hypothetical protein